MGYPVCPNRIHSSGINGPWKTLFEITKSFLGDGHRLKLFLGVWESGDTCINLCVFSSAVSQGFSVFCLLRQKYPPAVKLKECTLRHLYQLQTFKTAKKIIVQALVLSLCMCILDRIFYKVVISDIYRCCCSCEPKTFRKTLLTL